MALSDVKVKAAKVPEDKKQGKLADSGGLYLLIKAFGKYWRLDYRFGDKRKTMALGVHPQVSLKEARDKRESAKKLLEKNIDPSQSKRTDRRKAIMKSNEATFKGVATEWFEIDLEKAEWRIPAEKMKMRMIHIVPLSQQVIDILKELQPCTPPTGTGETHAALGGLSGWIKGWSHLI